MKITDDLKTATASQSNLAKALGLSRQRVSQLLQEGVLATDEKNQILVIKSVINYVKYKGQSSAEEVSSSDDAVFEVEKAKNERAKRKIAELKLAKMNGEVYSADTVEQVMTEMLVNLRTQLLGLPTKLAPQLQNITKEEAYNLLTQEIEDKLSELSEYTPSLFMDSDELDDDKAPSLICTHFPGHILFTSLNTWMLPCILQGASILFFSGSFCCCNS